jgi:hypothetical protein
MELGILGSRALFKIKKKIKNSKWIAILMRNDRALSLSN